MDALRGREALRLAGSDLHAFYQEDYVQQHPDLDAGDAQRKARELAEVFRAAGLVSPRRILEVGCGSGALLAEMRSLLHTTSATGVDYGSVQAHQAAAQSGAQAVVADAIALPFKEASFDLAYAADVLEHVASPVTLLRELARVAGYVGFLIPIEAGLIASLLYAYRRSVGKPTNLEHYGHIWRWFRLEARALLRSAGLVVISSAVHSLQVESGTTVRGRSVAAVHATLRRCSARSAELLFGGVVWVGVARLSRMK